MFISGEANIITSTDPKANVTASAATVSMTSANTSIHRQTHTSACHGEAPHRLETIKPSLFRDSVLTSVAFRAPCQGISGARRVLSVSEEPAPTLEDSPTSVVRAGSRTGCKMVKRHSSATPESPYPLEEVDLL